MTASFGHVDYQLGTRYTWADIERAAYHSGVLAQAVAAVRHGIISREDALCTVAMYLAEVQIRNMNEQVERLSMVLPAPVILQLPREPYDV